MRAAAPGRIVRRHHEVVRLARNGHEVEPESARGGKHAEPAVGAARGHRGGDRQVRVLLARVAADRLGRDPPPAELVVEQHARARTALAVDVAQARRSSISRTPSGLPGATISPCSRCTRRMTATARSPSTRPTHGSV